MKRSEGRTMREAAARVARFAAACAFAAFASLALSAPAPGTIVSNQASASGQTASGTTSTVSNTVTFPVSACTNCTFGALLQTSHQVDSRPGATVLLTHTLTNTGTTSDTFTIVATPLDTSGWSFTSIAILPDANGDGVPDSNTPLGAQTLAAGQTLRFVVRYVIPAGAPLGSENSVRLVANGALGTVSNPVGDRILLPDTTITLDCGTVAKTLSRTSGPSPAGPVTVTLAYGSCDKARGKLVLFDILPAGMKYIAGSGRWSGTGATVLSDDVQGDDRQGTSPQQVAYDFNVSRAGAVTATVFNVPANGGGTVTFDVQVAPGLATGTRIDNTAGFTFYDTNNAYQGLQYTLPATYTVTGHGDFDLVGDRLSTVTPGTTVSFNNVLTNRGDFADTYDVTFTGSTFPAGTTFQLFKADGVTPLADTDGDGVADTGSVAPGASYRIVLRATIPANAPPGAYKVTKVARSAASPAATAQADDVVDAITTKCVVSLDPDNNAQIGFGQHVTYTHFLTNRGNCSENVQARVDYLSDSRPGWTSKVYIDNASGTGGSMPGALDATDTPVVPGWTTTLAPGQTLRLLVDVNAPTMTAFQALAKASGKALTDSDVTTVVISSTSSGALTVKDTTVVAEQSGPGTLADVIRNFTDDTYNAPTLWALSGGNLWLRADAASCNARADQVDVRTVVITGPNGEREELVATETGPDTGVFLVPSLPVRKPPVVAGDRVLEGNAGDVYDVQLLGCGRTIDTLVTIMDPRAVVFDAATNAGVAGATVTLVSASGGQCGTTPVAATGNPARTGSDGRYSFPTVATGGYCLRVDPPNGYRAPSTVAWPQLPTGHNLVVSGLTSGGSYGGAFTVGASGLVVVDIPVDAVAQAGLFVQKAASRATVELGEFVDYTVKVRNGTGNALDRADVTLADGLPAGFGYVKGTARRDGQAIADPAGGAGPRLVFKLGTFSAGAESIVTYRVRVGPGALKGDGVNRAQARYFSVAETLSNVASAQVTVTGGVFTEKGYILGKVFTDCNGNGLQDAGERGVPGVRVLLEDGTFVITDAGGKFSFYGVSDHTHVVKVDRASLPEGAALAATSQRHLGDGGSRIVDLKAGELARADFAIAGCTPAVIDAVQARIEATGSQDELAAMMATPLTTDARPAVDAKALPASGLVQAAPGATGVGSAGLAMATSPTPARTTQPASPFFTDGRPTPASAAKSPGSESARAREERVPFESVLPQMDKTLAFVNLADGQVLDEIQTTVRVKGSAGAKFTLTVNGAEIPASQVGKKAVLAEKQVQGWEYIGVDLKPGENELTLAQVDGFGNARGKVTIKVLAPGGLSKVLLALPGGAVADGKTPARIAIKLVDEKGTPIVARTPVTIDASLGRWKTEDLDPNLPGLQLIVEGGRADVELLPPLEPGAATVTATAGPAKTIVRLDFLPELRNMVATGVLEGIVNMRRASSAAISPVRASDAFEQELQHLSREWNDGKTQAGARAAFYLKGKIKGDYLLTAAYDSDKDTKERLFRDIQPDEFYPVYGDSGVRGFDAQSTSRLYVRVDRNRSYLLWGDFTTQVANDTRKLSNYTRSLTGVKEHFETDRVSVNAFASRDSTRQVIEELRANGTSGPYLMSTPNALVNSEKVEILVRDRNQPALVLSSTPQARFSDYEVEAVTGRILFKAPVPSVDRDLNPVFVRISYEVDQGGEQFWVAGVDAQVKVTDRIEVGGAYVRDQNPLAPFRMGAVNARVAVGAGTVVTGEVARTEDGVDLKKGDAARVEVKHESDNLKANAYVGRTDKDFNNPSSYLNQGRGEAGGKLDYRLSDKTSIKGEALRTEDVTTGAVRDGLALSIQHRLHDHLTVEIGVRHAKDKGTGSAVPAVMAPDGQVIPTQPLPEEVTSVRAKAIVTVPQVQGLTVYGEAEADVHDTDRKIVAAGAEYQLPNKGRLYARHEFISSLTGPYGLNANERQNTTAVGVDTEYMKDGKVFSEYRVRDAIAGGDTEAAIGLRNLWTIAPGWRLGTTLERVQVLAGNDQAENKAAALALEYTGSAVWKGSSRLEVRDSHTTESLLFTVGLAAKLSRDVTLLARNAYSGERNKATGGEHVIDRMQAGLAFRDNETNRWNALARVEKRVERDDETTGVDLKTDTTILSLHGDWQLSRPFLVSGRYAAKWAKDDSNGLSTKYRAQVVGVRGTWEFAPKWDVSLVMSSLFGETLNSRQYGVGVEVGYLLATNLWVSAGYNFAGYRDADMAGADYTAKGPFVRLRYKFDESVLDGMTAKGAAKEDGRSVRTAAGEGK